MNGFVSPAAHYAHGRQGFPPEPFQLLRARLERMSGPHLLLDAGCGTGIPTRQLVAELKNARVTGVDKDPAMLAEAARWTPSDRIDYKHSDLSLIGAKFQPETFAAVTAFSAFHWFCDNHMAMSGIVDVLRSGGCLIAVNKYATKEVIPQWPRVLDRWTKEPVQRQKEKTGYDPIGAMNLYGLTPTPHSWPVAEYYTIPEALELLQSSSLWNAVPEESKDSARRELGEKIAAQARHGIVTREVSVVTVLGIKS